jgi:uncharacterized protein
MILLLSPSKDMNPSNCSKIKGTQPLFLSQSEAVIEKLKTLSVADIETKMKVSNKLALINYERIKRLTIELSDKNATHAISTYSGDVYAGLDATSISSKDIQLFQNNLFILSAMYGVLRPFDLIQAYRLEMQTSSFEIGKSKNLYQYWTESISGHIINVLGKEMLINLASDEYSKLVLPSIPENQVININFREIKNGEPKFVSTFAKKARGLFTRFAIMNKIKSPLKLKEFNLENYKFNAELSTKNEWFFVR